VAGQELGPSLIMNPAYSIIMTATIEFDCQSRSRTIEIEDVSIDRMLAPEFVAREIPVPKTAPQNAFTICCMLSERLSAAHQKEIS
jgi:hypothetical protein